MFPIVAVGEEPKSLPAFIIGKNGIYMRKESALGVSTTKVSKIAHLDDVQPSLDYRLPKIPAKLSGLISGFLLKVDRKFHTEGAVLLCLNKKRKWEIVIPRQDIGGAQVKYFVDPDTVPQGWLLAGTVHSHPFNTTTAPTPSWTDEDDERKIDGVHFVAGSLSKEPKYSAAVVIDGTRFKYLDWTELMEPAEANIDAVPDEWLTKCEGKKSFAQSIVGAVTSSYGGSYTGGSSYTSHAGLFPKDGETDEQALARYDKTQLKWLIEDAAKLGYKFTWSLEPLAEGEKVTTEVAASFDSTPKYESVAVGKDANGQLTLIAPPVPKPVPPSNEGGTVWADADLIECEGKHPYRDCPKGCGCHCDPCRKKLVGSWRPQPGTVLNMYANQVECECKTCYGGCAMTVHLDDIVDGEPALCGLCLGGSHYTKADETGAAEEDTPPLSEMI